MTPCPTGKRQHDTYKFAEAVRLRMAKQFGYLGEIYVCRHCGYLHVGRKRKDLRKARKAAKEALGD